VLVPLLIVFIIHSFFRENQVFKLLTLSTTQNVSVPDHEKGTYIIIS